MMKRFLETMESQRQPAEIDDLFKIDKRDIHRFQRSASIEIVILIPDKLFFSLYIYMFYNIQ